MAQIHFVDRYLVPSQETVRALIMMNTIRGLSGRVLDSRLIGRRFSIKASGIPSECQKLESRSDK